MRTQGLTLARGDSAFLYLDFEGLPDGSTARVQVGESDWHDADFSTGRPQVLLRGPDAAGSSGLLVAKSGPIRVQVLSAPETRTISGGYLTLVQASA